METDLDIGLQLDSVIRYAYKGNKVKRLQLMDGKMESTTENI